MTIRVEHFEHATIYLGDALDVLQTTPHIDATALICDPPYCSGGFTEAAKRMAKGQGLRSETLRAEDYHWFGGDNMTTGGLVWLLRAVAVAFKNHADGDGATASFFADWRMVPVLAPAIESAGLRFQAMPIWDKGTAGLGTGFRAQHECILHYAIGVPLYHSASYGNVLRAARMPSERDHPTEKPLGLIAKMVEVQSARGGTVLDPFMGSGTTGVAAVRSGRKFVGMDHDPIHFDTACYRIAEAHGVAPLQPQQGALV